MDEYIIGVNAYGDSIVLDSVAYITDATFLDSACIALWQAILS